MKLVGGLVFSLLVASTIFGQSAPAPSAASTPSPAPVTNAAPASQSNLGTPQSRVPGQTMSPAELNAMRMGQLMRLSDELKAMHTKLDEMKANAAKVKDPTLKQQLQLDNELWAMMLSHMQQLTASVAQSRSLGRFGPGDQAYRMQHQAMRPLPSPASPATSAAPVAPESKPVAPADHP
jgi:hypothetical protein